MTSLSISDNDICSRCKHCVYNPGENSFCDNDWPAKPNIDDEFQECNFYSEITSEFENWSVAAIQKTLD